PLRPFAPSSSPLSTSHFPESASRYVIAENLGKTYQTGRNRVVVFEGLDFQIARREMVAIVGPSGSGKSTLLHLLGGLDRPTLITVKVGEFDIAKLANVDLVRFRNREIGFIFQFHHLLPEFTAIENVMMPLLISRTSHQVASQQAESMLERVGLADRSVHRPGELSGGEQARVALARALIGSPGLLLLDEPTGDLDAKTGESIHALLKEIHQSRGLTSIVVTHNERLAAICDRVLHLEDGRLT